MDLMKIPNWLQDTTIDKHHLVPKSRLKKGATPMKRNRLRIKRCKHNAYHILFGDKSLREAILLLQRLYQIKGGERETRLGENQGERDN